MKAVFFETPEEDKKRFEELLADTDIDAVFSEETLSANTIALARDAEAVSVFVNSQVTKDIFNAMPQVKLISTRSVGFDHIDTEYAKSKGIAIASVPAYGTHTVAEFTFALLLALSRKILPAYRHLREDESFDITGLTGINLYQKTIGIVGTGRIGKSVATIANGFGMNVLGCDLHPDEALSAEQKVNYCDMPALFAQSDIVSLHAPYMKETHHMINKETLASFKQGALLINTARGELVDTEALVAALNSGHIAGAGLDVLEGERYMKEESALLVNDHEDAMETKEGFKTILESHALLHHPHVIVTPHMAYFTKEAKDEILQTTVDNIVSFGKGAPQNVLK